MGFKEMFTIAYPSTLCATILVLTHLEKAASFAHAASKSGHELLKVSKAGGAKYDAMR